jgi:phosphotriesterase-related protein
MLSWNAAGKIQTVLGLIEPDELGVTLTHEHLLVDLTVILNPPIESSARQQFFAPMSQDSLAKVRYYGEVNYANYQVLDVDTAIAEVDLYKQYGGASLVDATSIGIARDPVGLSRISRTTGVNVVMGASFYVDPAHPDYVLNSNEDELAAQIIRDVNEGVDGTGIRSGVIGEVGCSWPLTPSERKILRASAKAQRATGAPILIHPGRDETSPLQIIEILEDAGADLNRTIMGHLDRTVFERETLSKIGQSGCYFEWDLFGNESSSYKANPDIDHPNDGTKVQHIAWLISEGYGDKITIAHDICTNHRLVKYGGHGYFYILKHIVPLMRDRGFDEESINQILVGNPASALTFVEPA